jgi:DNA-binding MarR family transcriptional regulator
MEQIINQYKQINQSSGDKMLNELFGPSNFLLVLDLFLQHPDELMNMREVARRLKKNPGSISKVLPKLLSRNYIVSIKVGEKTIVYRLNKESELIQLLIRFNENVEQTI